MSSRRRQRTRPDDGEGAEEVRRPRPRRSIEERMEDVLQHDDDDADEPIVVHSIPVRMPAGFQPDPPPAARVAHVASDTAHNTEGQPPRAPASSSSPPSPRTGGRPRRRATHDSGSSSAAVSSVTSDCIIRKHSLRFKHSDSRSFYSSSSSSSSDESYASDSNGGGVEGWRRPSRLGEDDRGGGGMEVMDLRPGSHLSGKGVGDDGRPVSLSSNVIIDIESMDGLFPTASGAASQEGDADLPPHWDRAARPAGEGGPGGAAANPYGGSEQAQQALMRLMRDRNDSDRSLFRASGRRRRRNGQRRSRSLSRDRRARRRGGSSVGSSVGSRSSRGSGRSGSGQGSSVGSGSSLESDARSFGVMSCGSSKLWDTLESKGSQHRRASYDSALTMYSAESSQEGTRRRQPVGRRCFRAMVSTLALAALSLLIVYVTSSEEGRDAMFGFLPSGGWLGGVASPFSGDPGTDGDHQLRFRRLPQGGGAAEFAARDRAQDWAAPKDFYDNDNPNVVQDKIQLERTQNMHPRRNL